MSSASFPWGISPLVRLTHGSNQLHNARQFFDGCLMIQLKVASPPDTLSCIWSRCIEAFGPEYEGPKQEVFK